MNITIDRCRDDARLFCITADMRPDHDARLFQMAFGDPNQELEAAMPDIDAWAAKVRAGLAKPGLTVRALP